VSQTPALITAISSNSPVCSGNDIQLQSETILGATYSWTGPNGFVSSVEDPLISGVTTAVGGTYYLIVIVNGCSSLANANSTTMVTVNQTPALITAISSNSPVCSGNDIQLQSETIPGASYSWTGPNGFVSSVEDPLISGVTTAAGGTYDLIVTVNGCSSLANANSTTTVTVNQTPALITAINSNSPVCSGNDIQLQSETILGASYSWTGPNGFTSTLEDPVISSSTLLDGGTYELIVTVNGCSSAADANSSTNVVVNSLPVLSLLDTVNACGISPYIYELTGFDTYSWSSGSLTNQDTIVSSGVYAVTVELNGCFVSDSSFVLMGAFSDSAGAFSNSQLSICPQSPFFFYGVGGSSIFWTGPNGFSSVMYENEILSVSEENQGTYEATLIYADGCSQIASIELNVLSPDECVEIPELVTPNGDGLNDLFVLDFLKYYPNNSVKIFNRWGNEVFAAAPYNNDWFGQTNREILLKNELLPVGSYFVLINTGEKVIKVSIELNY